MSFTNQYTPRERFDDKYSVEGSLNPSNAKTFKLTLSGVTPVNLDVVDAGVWVVWVDNGDVSTSCELATGASAGSPATPSSGTITGAQAAFRSDQVERVRVRAGYTYLTAALSAALTGAVLRGVWVSP